MVQQRRLKQIWIFLLKWKHLIITCKVNWKFLRVTRLRPIPDTLTVWLHEPPQWYYSRRMTFSHAYDELFSFWGIIFYQQSNTQSALLFLFSIINGSSARPYWISWKQKKIRGQQQGRQLLWLPVWISHTLTARKGA